MKPKPPFRLAVLQRLAACGSASPADITAALTEDYAGERQLNEASVENHLLALRAVGLVEIKTGGTSAPGATQYSITRQGRARLEKSIR